MKRFLLALALLPCAFAGIVTDVRASLERHDFPAAERQFTAWRSAHPAELDTIEAASWLARGALREKRLDDAARWAGETRTLALAQLKTRKLDSEKRLPLALGASIEVQAGVLAARGERSEAVSFLRRERKTWWASSMRARIQKNLNMLTLEGKPAPAIDVQHWLGAHPQPLSALRGRPVLLFFWAHWCPDCKSEIPILAQVERNFAPRGLVLMGPTQHYGYVARGEDAPPGKETQYIDQVRRTVYAPLGDMPVPLGEEAFRVYGASTVPTLVLVDRAGIVRLYHPNVMSYDELAAVIEKTLARPQ